MAVTPLLQGLEIIQVAVVVRDRESHATRQSSLLGNGPWRVYEFGPHMMVLNIGDHFAGYPTTSENTQVPYVMFSKTKYAHLMLPVK